MRSLLQSSNDNYPKLRECHKINILLNDIITTFIGLFIIYRFCVSQCNDIWPSNIQRTTYQSENIRIHTFTIFMILKTKIFSQKYPVISVHLLLRSNHYYTSLYGRFLLAFYSINNYSYAKCFQLGKAYYKFLTDFCM